MGEGWAQGGEGFCRAVGPNALVLGDEDGFTATLWYRDRHDLVVEAAVLARGCGELVRPSGERVLVFAAELQVGAVLVGRLPHRHVVERIGQPVECGGVKELDRPVAEPAT